MVELSCYKFIGVFISKQPEERGGNPKSDFETSRTVLVLSDYTVSLLSTSRSSSRQWQTSPRSLLCGETHFYGEVWRPFPAAWYDHTWSQTPREQLCTSEEATRARQTSTELCSSSTWRGTPGRAFPPLPTTRSVSPLLATMLL